MKDELNEKCDHLNWLPWHTYFGRIITFFSLIFFLIPGNSSKCGFFGPIENGKIELSAYDENEVRQFYTVSCHPGFELNGPSRLVCEKGVWVNSSWPYCIQSMPLTFLCKFLSLTNGL